MPKRINLTTRGHAPFLFPRILALFLSVALALPANPALALRQIQRQESGLEELKHAIAVPDTGGTPSGLEERGWTRRGFVAAGAVGMGALALKTLGVWDLLLGGEAKPAPKPAAPAALTIPKQATLTVEKKARMLLTALNELQKAKNVDAPDRVLKFLVPSYNKQWRALSNDQKWRYALEAARVEATEAFYWERIAQAPKARGFKAKEVQEFLKAVNARLTFIIPWQSVMAILFKETADFNTKAHYSNDGVGLMQVNRTTLRGLWSVVQRYGLVHSRYGRVPKDKSPKAWAKKLGVKESDLLFDLLTDPTFNVQVGILYLRELYAMVQDERIKTKDAFVLIMYNRGPTYTVGMYDPKLKRMAGGALAAASAAGVPLVYWKVEPYYKEPIVYHVKKGDGFVQRKMQMDEAGFAIGTDYAQTASTTAELLDHSTASVSPALAGLTAQPAAGLEEGEKEVDLDRRLTAGRWAGGVAGFLLGSLLGAGTGRAAAWMWYGQRKLRTAFAEDGVATDVDSSRVTLQPGKAIPGIGAYGEFSSEVIGPDEENRQPSSGLRDKTIMVIDSREGSSLRVSGLLLEKNPMSSCTIPVRLLDGSLPDTARYDMVNLLIRQTENVRKVMRIDLVTADGRRHPMDVAKVQVIGMGPPNWMAYAGGMEKGGPVGGTPAGGAVHWRDWRSLGPIDHLELVVSHERPGPFQLDVWAEVVRSAAYAKIQRQETFALNAGPILPAVGLGLAGAFVGSKLGEDIARETSPGGLEEKRQARERVQSFLADLRLKLPIVLGHELTEQNLGLRGLAGLEEFGIYLAAEDHVDILLKLVEQDTVPFVLTGLEEEVTRISQTASLLGMKPIAVVVETQGIDRLLLTLLAEASGLEERAFRQVQARYPQFLRDLKALAPSA